MKIGRVVGTVVAPENHAFFTGHKLLLVRPEKPDGRAAGPPVVAVDRAQAGAGDRVLLLHEGSGARDVVGVPDAPVRAVVVAFIDEISLEPGEPTHGGSALDVDRERSGGTR